jgi:hypothetical protein
MNSKPEPESPPRDEGSNNSREAAKEPPKDKPKKRKEASKRMPARDGGVQVANGSLARSRVAEEGSSLCFTEESAPDGTGTVTEEASTWKSDVPEQPQHDTSLQDEPVAGGRSKFSKAVLRPLQAATENGSTSETLTPSPSSGRSPVVVYDLAADRSPVVYDLASEDHEMPPLPAEFLTQLSDANLDNFAGALAHLGVESISDLHFLEDRELKRIGMRLVHIRKLRALALGELLGEHDIEETADADAVFGAETFPIASDEEDHFIPWKVAPVASPPAEEADASAPGVIVTPRDRGVSPRSPRSPRSYAKGPYVKAMQHQILNGASPESEELEQTQTAG